jgi:hypothetical protein
MGAGPARRSGDRPLVADRDRLDHRRQSARARHCCRSSTGRRPCRCRATTCRFWTMRAIRCRPERWATSSSSCRCRRAVCRRCGRRRSASQAPISRSSRATTRRPMPAIMDEDGYLFIMARTDDIINVAGHRLSTGGMEEVLAGHPDVAECAVIGVVDTLKGQLPCGFVVLKAGVNRPHAEIEAELVKRVRDRSARWRPSSWRSPSNACRRRARARSCAAPCARSPTGPRSGCPRQSTIRRFWRKSRKR